VSKEEALQYLELREIDKEQVAQIYELIGGRMIHLKDMADKIERKGTFEGMCMLYRKRLVSHRLCRYTQEDVLQGRSQLESAEILRTGRYHKEGAVIVHELLKKGSVSRRAFYDLVSPDTRNKLLETNIFAYHFNSQEITLQSTVMKRYCEENSALWEGK
jgi:hypothetical protein